MISDIKSMYKDIEPVIYFLKIYFFLLINTFIDKY